MAVTIFVTLAVLVIAMSILPFVAAYYARFSIWALTDTAQPDPSPPVASNKDLGIRSLPLISDDLRELWLVDPDEARESAGRAVFGANWTTYIAVAQDLGDRGSFEAYPYDFGRLTGLASQAIAELDTDVGAVDLTSVLVLESARWGLDTGVVGIYADRAFAIAAFALAEATAKRGTCDGAIQRAFILGLEHRYEVLAMAANQVIQAWDDAIELCPTDPTPVIEKVKYLVGNYDLSLPHAYQQSAWQASIMESGAWELVIADLDEQLGDWGDLCAAWVVKGDTYRMLADTVQRGAGMGPFTVAEFLSRADDSYTHASWSTSMPSVGAAMSLMRGVNGDPGGALSALGPYIRDTPDQEVLRTGAYLAALKKNYRLAIQRETAAQNSRDTDITGVVEYPRGAVVHQPGSLQLFTAIGYAMGGADSRTENFDFVPAYRMSSAPGYVETPTLLDYALLAADWSEVSRICQEAMSQLCPQPGVTTVADYVHSVSDVAADYYQDLFRRFHDLVRAKQVVLAWSSANPHSPQPHERLGELYFLAQNWKESMAASMRALDRYPTAGLYPTDDDWGWDDLASYTGPGWTQLRAAAAARQSQQYSAARAYLDSAYETQLAWDPDGMEADVVEEAGYADLLMLDILQEQGALGAEQGLWEDAWTFMVQSIEVREALEHFEVEGVAITRIRTIHGTQEQVISMSARMLKDMDAAIEWAEKAIATDPFSPLFQETMAEAQRASLAEDDLDLDARAELIAFYYQAVNTNPSLFSSWNNLGVLLAQDGAMGEAIFAFEQALVARSDYAIAWFNLGTVLADRPGVGNFLRSQGALGQAGLISVVWKDRDPSLQFDEEIYASGVDISKPIPHDWQLDTTVRFNTTALTIGLLLMIAIRIGWDLGKDWLTGKSKQGALSVVTTRMAKYTKYFYIHPVITTAITWAVLVWLSGASGMTEIVICTAGVGLLLGLHLSAPHLIAQSSPVRHRSFLPGSVTTAILAPFGLGFVPPAPLEPSDGETVLTTGAAILQRRW
ncbi:MAG: tetratricopeptide repeat protein [Propionibacteriaceae bacterium]|nr:tetratricopeptide repeat protein [Propionibacteriaceae bacterium]